MRGSLQRVSLDGRECLIFVPEGTGPWGVAFLCGGEMEPLLKELAPDLPEMLLFAPQADWERDYTPWPAPALPDRDPFLGGGPRFLRFLTETAKPWLDARFPTLPGSEHTLLAGYSLAGLFALWAACNTDLFGRVASLSGSLWYDGWVAYLQEHRPDANSRIYLSLGKREGYAPSTAHLPSAEPPSGTTRELLTPAGAPQPPRSPMAAVGDCTQQTFRLLAETLSPEQLVLEWNRGGHFTGIPNRWRKGLLWLTRDQW